MTLSIISNFILARIADIHPYMYKMFPRQFRFTHDKYNITKLLLYDPKYLLYIKNKPSYVTSEEFIFYCMLSEYNKKSWLTLKENTPITLQNITVHILMSFLYNYVENNIIHSETGYIAICVETYREALERVLKYIVNNTEEEITNFIFAFENECLNRYILIDQPKDICKLCNENVVNYIYECKCKCCVECAKKSNKCTNCNIEHTFDEENICICSICYSDGCDCVLPCEHRYHFTCINMWFHKKDECPMCNAKFELKIKYDKDKIKKHFLQKKYEFDSIHYTST